MKWQNPLGSKRFCRSRHHLASSVTSEGDGTRTRNHRIDSPHTSNSKAGIDNQIASTVLVGCSAGCSEDRDEGGLVDADLAALVAAWPMLPKPIKAAIRALVGSAAGPS